MNRIIRSIRLLLIPTVFLLPLNSFSQTEKTEFSLKEAQEYAVKNNASVKNALLDKEKATKKIWETTTIGLPQISAKGSYTYMLKVPSMDFRTPVLYNPVDSPNYDPKMISMQYLSTPIDLGVKSNMVFDFMVSQLVFSGSYIVGLQASKAYSQMTNLLYAKSINEINESVANAYFLVLIAEENKNILDSTFNNLSKTLAEMKSMYKEGFIENTDVDQIELTVNNMENTLNTLKQQVEIAYRLLKFQMGIDLEKPIVLTDKIVGLIDETKVERLISDSFEVSRTISYNILDNSEKLSELSLKLEKSSFLPTIAGYYQHEEKLNKPQFDFSVPDIIGASVNVPIFGSGQKLARVSQAQLELEKTRNTKEMASQGLILEAFQAQINLNTAFLKYKNQKQSLELAKKIYDKTYLKYKEGVSSSMDLTTAHTQYLTAQSGYYTAILELISAMNKYEKLSN